MLPLALLAVRRSPLARAAKNGQFWPLFGLFWPFLGCSCVARRPSLAEQNVSHLNTLEPPGWHRAGWGFRIAGTVLPLASLAVRCSPLARAAKNGQFWPVFGLFGPVSGPFLLRFKSSSSLCGQKFLALYFFVHGGVLSSIALFDRPLESLLLVVGDGLSDGVTVSACER